MNEGSDNDQRKQRMDDRDGWVAVSKSRVHQVISDLLEHEDTPSYQQTSSSVTVRFKYKSMSIFYPILVGFMYCLTFVC